VGLLHLAQLQVEATSERPNGGGASTGARAIVDFAARRVQQSDVSLGCLPNQVGAEQSYNLKRGLSVVTNAKAIPVLTQSALDGVETTGNSHDREKMLKYAQMVLEDIETHAVRRVSPRVFVDLTGKVNAPFPVKKSSAECQIR
jgi:hypothetical protein